MSDAIGKSRDSRGRNFYDSSVSGYARKRLVALVTRRDSPIVVTGDTGTGKSRLIRRVIPFLSARDNPVLIPDPRVGFQGLLDTVLKSLRVENPMPAADARQPQRLDRLRRHLLKENVKGRYVTLFIDDAHELETETLTGLFNLMQQPMQRSPLFGVVLAGLPTLEPKLGQKVFQDLLRTKPCYFHLRPLNAEETTEFVRNYLSAMGHQNAFSISSEVGVRIWDHSRGVLSGITTLCNELTLMLTNGDTKEIDPGIVAQAAARCSIALASTKRAPNSAGDGGPPVPESFAGESTISHADDSEQDRRDPRAPAEEQRVPEKQIGLKSDRDMRATSPESMATQALGVNRTGMAISMDRTTNLNNVLKKLQNESSDVEASALITEDGLIIASSLPQDLDENTVGGMSATLLSLGTRAAMELRRGDVKEVIVRGKQGYGVMVSAGRGVLLLVVANDRAKLGLIFFDMRAAINVIKHIL